MSNEELVLVDSPVNGVFVLTLNSPKVNALSTSMLERLHYLATDLTLLGAHAVIITGGDRLFAAGAEISEFGGPEEAATIGAAFHRALNAVAALPAFTIAAVSGYALGGGCELAMACDYRIASTKAVFGQPEILLGIIPGGGGTQRLPRLVGSSRAKELMITGRQVKADEAERIGLADEVVEPDQLMTRARELADTVAGGAAQASRIIKRVVDAGMNTTLEEGLQLEIDGFVEVFGTRDSQVGVKSFLENGPGKATFSGS
ncbi:MAG: enoyl-CoA hydratase/isomerase family protein [Acidimicrobiaceae bacterium]|jgi:enoyl-CoA hydratase/carnithine racemase|nr:enoyl-CoA hydratase-related protein [Ilumatobacteraceae bacterium]